MSFGEVRCSGVICFSCFWVYLQTVVEQFESRVVLAFILFAYSFKKEIVVSPAIIV